MAYYVAPEFMFPVLEPPYIIYRNPTCKDLSNNIAARKHPCAGSKQIATYQAVLKRRVAGLVAARERHHAVVGSRWPRTKQ